MSCCCQKTLRLCSVGTCTSDYVRTGINAPATGLYILIVSFLNTEIRINAIINIGEEIKFPTRGLNENYTFTAYILDPANATLIMTIDEVEYDCLEFETKLKWSFGITIDEEQPTDDTGSVKVFEAGENISSGIAVIAQDNIIYKFDPMNVDHLGRVIGVTKQSGLTGEDIEVQINGLITDASFAFLIDRPVFAQVGGALSSNVPVATIIIQSVGSAIDANTMNIQIDLPIKR